MKIKWGLKIIFLVCAILCGIVVGIMYTKLSFIDWPYAIGGIVFLMISIAIPVKKRIKKRNK
jgi:membrane-anchored protein YejM (alkaline phosphatase superfamily)